MKRSESASFSVVSHSLRPHGWQPTRLVCPWNFPGKNTGGIALPFSRGDVLDPRIEPLTVALQADLYHLSHKGSLRKHDIPIFIFLPQHCLGYMGSFVVPDELFVGLFVLVLKNVMGVFIQTALTVGCFEQFAHFSNNSFFNP